MDNEFADRLAQAIFSLSKSLDELTFELNCGDISTLPDAVDELRNALVK